MSPYLGTHSLFDSLCAPLLPHPCLSMGTLCRIRDIGVPESGFLSENDAFLPFRNRYPDPILIRSSLVVPHVLVRHIIRSSLAYTGICKAGSLVRDSRITKTGVVVSEYPLTLHQEKRSEHSSTVHAEKCRHGCKALRRPQGNHA